MGEGQGERGEKGEGRRGKEGAQRERGREGWGARQPKNCVHLRVPAFKNTTTNPRQDPTRGKKERTLRREREKKSEILVGPAEGGPGELFATEANAGQ